MYEYGPCTSTGVTICFNRHQCLHLYDNVVYAPAILEPTKEKSKKTTSSYNQKDDVSNSSASSTPCQYLLILLYSPSSPINILKNWIVARTKWLVELHQILFQPPQRKMEKAVWPQETRAHCLNHDFTWSAKLALEKKTSKLSQVLQQCTGTIRV